MDLRDSPREAAFRSRLRGWLSTNLPPDWARRQLRPGRWDLDVVRGWTRTLNDSGYAGLTWPVEYGGQGLPESFQAIYLEEAIAAGAPEHIGVIGLSVVGPTILACGRADQKLRHLPRILSGETVFCQGFS